MNFKSTIKSQINQVLEKKYQLKGVDFQVEYPPAASMGDYASNVAMTVAKQLKKNPLAVAEEMSKNFKNLPWLAKIEVFKPGFLNFYLAENFLIERIKEILKQKEKFGSSKIGKGKKIVIDYSAPNVAKNMHVGHLRSTIIGDALAWIFEFLGYQIISDNHVGDWGTQYGILLYEYKNKYGEQIKKDLNIDDLEKMYVDYLKKEKKDPKIREKAKLELKKLQAKEKINFKLWQYFYKISRFEFEKIYQQLKIRKFDLWCGESFYNLELNKIVSQALEKKVAIKSEGAIIIPLDKFNLPPLLIQKSDDAYLYGTTDLATIAYRHKKYHPEKILYVVANQQALHFEQLFHASALLKLHDKEELEHIKFGLMLNEEGKKMSTREGGVIKLNELIDKIILKAREVVEEKNPNLLAVEKDEIAKKIGIGALKYNDLSQNRLSDITFDWQKMLSFENGSAPYLQYTFVRIESILKKSNIKPQIKNLGELNQTAEIELMRKMNKFDEIILEAAATYRPNIIANYLDNLASTFHGYYETVPIIKSTEKTQAARLALISAVARVIKNGLALLGIEVMEKM